MPKIKKEELDVLIKLQEIQNEIKRLTRILSTVDSKKEKLDSELLSFKLLLDTDEGCFLEAKKRHSDLETEHMNNETRIEKSRETLKVITTNKEYQVLLREIDDNVKKNSAMEDELIELMEEIETSEKTVKERRAEYASVLERINGEKDQLEKSCKDDKEDLADYLAELDIVGEALDPKLLQRFKAIAADAGGIAVVPVKDSICMGCYMNIPPQVNIEVKRGGTLNFCSQCHRILYWQEAEEVEVE